MRMIINGFAAAAMLVALPALAETKPGTPVPTASGAPSDTVARDQRYCVVSSMTGSRIAKKVCKTRSEWMDQENFDPLDPRK